MYQPSRMSIMLDDWYRVQVMEESDGTHSELAIRKGSFLVAGVVS
jgi:hypothetical protein